MSDDLKKRAGTVSIALDGCAGAGHIIEAQGLMAELIAALAARDKEIERLKSLVRKVADAGGQILSPTVLAAITDKDTSDE